MHKGSIRFILALSGILTITNIAEHYFYTNKSILIALALLCFYHMGKALAELTEEDTNV